MFSSLAVCRTLIFMLLIFSIVFVLPVYSQEYVPTKSLINKGENWYKFQGNIELGFLSILSHTIQFGTTGTKFDYVDEGNQNVLFPFTRITAEMNMSKRHSIIFLIQPFDIKNNLMNSDENKIIPSTKGKDLTEGQLEKIKKTVVENKK